MSNRTDTSTDRRTFVGRMGAGAAALSLGAPGSLAAAMTPSGADPQLEAWFDRIQGSHKAVFDAPAINGGLPAIWPRVYFVTMKEAYPDLRDSDNTAVLILRHSAIAMGMQDAMWAKYGFGEELGVNDGDRPAMRNVFASIEGLPLPQIGVRNLVDSGVLVGICNMALTVESMSAAARTGGDAAAIKQEWIDHLIPGIQVVPSGVMAVVRAQEKGCALVFAG
jgi:intracellular sulfur oxidation DsrE/DsrF family protein